MKERITWIAFVLVSVTVFAWAQTVYNTPISNGLLQTDLDGGGFSITNVASGTGLSNVATVGYVTTNFLGTSSVSVTSGTMSIGTTGTNLVIAPTGTATNIGLTIQPKGSGAGALWDTVLEAASLDWINRKTFDSAIVESQDWESRTLTDATGIVTIEWNALKLSKEAVASLDWGLRETYDSSGNPTINWNEREVFDSSLTTSINWDFRTLYNSAGTPTLDWENEELIGGWNADTLEVSTSIEVAGGSGSGGTTLNTSISTDFDVQAGGSMTAGADINASGGYLGGGSTTGLNMSTDGNLLAVGSISIDGANITSDGTGNLSALSFISDNVINNASLSAFATIQSASPTTGQTVIFDDGFGDNTLYLTPAGTLATLTVSLPSSGNSVNGQIARLFSTQIITALTVDVAGSGTLQGTAVTTLAANTGAAWQRVSSSGNGTWIRLY